MIKKNYIEIYEDFIRAKIGQLTVMAVSKKWKISRQAVYQIADIVSSGKQLEYRSAMLSLKWKYIYQATYNVVKNIKTMPEKTMFAKMLRAMQKDGFNVLEMSIVTGRNRRTIYKYLEY